MLFLITGYGDCFREKLTCGFVLPMVGLGTWSMRGAQCIESVRSAIDSGYRLIDTASFYGNELEVGQAVRLSGVSRNQIVIQTKLYPDQYEKAQEAIDLALRKLDLDYIDILMLHHPADNDLKAYRAIERAIEKSQVRAAGLSCYYVNECSRFLPQVEVKPILIQNEIHPLYQDCSVIEHIQSLGIQVQSWYPFGGRGHTAKLFANPVLFEIARNHGKTVAQIVLRWHLERGVAVIPGSVSAEHMRENIALFDFSLTHEEMRQIATLDRHEKHDWY